MVVLGYSRLRSLRDRFYNRVAAIVKLTQRSPASTPDVPERLEPAPIKAVAFSNLNVVTFPTVVWVVALLIARLIHPPSALVARKPM